MINEKKTRVTLQPKENDGNTMILIDDRAATRKAIINYVNKKLNSKSKFLERSNWHAKSSKGKLILDWDYDSIVIHHQGNENFGWVCHDTLEEVKNIQNNHMIGKQNFDDIGYHYIIGCDGIIAEGRDIRFRGSHVRNNNSNKIGILLIGDYSERGEVLWKNKTNIKDYILDQLDFFYSSKIPLFQLDSINILVSALIEYFNITTLGGHREFSLPDDKRTCPGNIGIKLVESLRNKFNLKSPKR